MSPVGSERQSRLEAARWRQPWTGGVGLGATKGRIHKQLTAAGRWGNHREEPAACLPTLR